MRDCIFLTADKHIEAMVTGFLGRQGAFRSLGCRAFLFDRGRDVLLAAGGISDPGVYTKGHELLRRAQRTHMHAVAILDAEWQGAPPPRQIMCDIEQNLVQTGWRPENVCAIAIDPEVEAWVWSDSPHVAKALGWDDMTELKEFLRTKGLWAPDEAKPVHPKEAAQSALATAGKTISSARYGRIAGQVGIAACQDPALLRLASILRKWFPSETA